MEAQVCKMAAAEKHSQRGPLTGEPGKETDYERKMELAREERQNLARTREIKIERSR